MQYTNSERPLWALVDCNNFFASCERLFRPDLEGKPIVVLSNNDGCIVARSNEAKALGIPMGEPEFKARSVLHKHNVHVFSSNYALYGDISTRVMDTLRSVCPHVEQYSIDEAFVRLDGPLRAQVDDVARALRERVRQWTGMGVSVGVASTRTLAKIANHLAKKEGGVYRLPSPSGGGAEESEAALDAVLARIPVREVWGVGRNMATRLYGVGITSALELKRANDLWARKVLTVTGWRMVLELRGLPCIGEDSGPPPPRTLVSSRSFGERVYARDDLAQAVAAFTARAAERLRRKGLVAGGIAVHIRTARKGTGPLCDETAQMTLPGGTADSMALIHAAHRGLDSIFKEGYAYAKAGIMLYHLENAAKRQGSLLTLTTEKASHECGKGKPEVLHGGNQEARQRALMHALDGIRGRYGSQGIRIGAEGPEKAVWHMRQRHCSPHMTTVWDELAVARCR